jgi:hypothetical protein
MKFKPVRVSLASFDILEILPECHAESSWQAYDEVWESLSSRADGFHRPSRFFLLNPDRREAVFLLEERSRLYAIASCPLSGVEDLAEWESFMEWYSELRPKL